MWSVLAYPLKEQQKAILESRTSTAAVPDQLCEFPELTPKKARGNAATWLFLLLHPKTQVISQFL